MKRRRPSLAALMGIVGLAALWLAGLRSGSPLLFKASYAVTVLALVLSVGDARFRSGAQRAFWIGFAVFGWAYFLTGFIFLRELATTIDIPLPGPTFPTAALMGRLSDVLQPVPDLDQYPPDKRLERWLAYVEAKEVTIGIGHLTLVWASGIDGGLIAWAIATIRQSSDRGPEQAKPLDPI